MAENEMVDGITDSIDMSLSKVTNSEINIQRNIIMEISKCPEAKQGLVFLTAQHGPVTASFSVDSGACLIGHCLTGCKGNFLVWLCSFSHIKESECIKSAHVNMKNSRGKQSKK